jgi:NADH:ubiquinone oxidoreductase subunit B-like Fe-S oxidoreductase
MVAPVSATDPHRPLLPVAPCHLTGDVIVVKGYVVQKGAPLLAVIYEGVGYRP